MKNKELKENINKIKDLFQSNNYEAGFELLKTLNEPKLNENLADLILSKVENEYLPSFGKSSNAEEGFNILYLLIPDVVKLEVKSCVLQNADGLANLTNLTSLGLHDCSSLQNVDGLANLTKLTSLNLSSCSSLQNVDGLANLTKLTSLDLSFCHYPQNLDGLANLPNLTHLKLKECYIVNYKWSKHEMTTRKEVAAYQEEIRKSMK